MQNSGLYAVAAKPSTRGEGAERSEADEVGRESLQNFMAEGTRTTLSGTVKAKPQNQTAARRHCNNPAAAGNVPPHQSAAADSFLLRGSQTSRQKAYPTEKRRTHLLFPTEWMRLFLGPISRVFHALGFFK